MPYKDPEKKKEQARRYRNLPHIREKLLKYHRKYNRKYEPKYNLKRRVKRWQVKIIVLNHYSEGNPKCKCCGILEPELLTIDHIKGRGNPERRRLKIPGGAVFYQNLIKRNFPPGYRVLCFNCNFAFGGYKVCPHAREKIRISMEELFG